MPSLVRYSMSDPRLSGATRMTPSSSQSCRHDWSCGGGSATRTARTRDPFCASRLLYRRTRPSPSRNWRSSLLGVMLLTSATKTAPSRCQARSKFGSSGRGERGSIPVLESISANWFWVSAWPRRPRSTTAGSTVNGSRSRAALLGSACLYSMPRPGCRKAVCLALRGWHLYRVHRARELGHRIHECSRELVEIGLHRT
jgi:hypothetical protein